MPRGLYRTRTPESGAEYAFMDYGNAPGLGEIPRALYEERGYLPRFDDLPTKETYDAEKASKSDDGEGPSGEAFL
jgi:hypothetical protein